MEKNKTVDEMILIIMFVIVLIGSIVAVFILLKDVNNRKRLIDNLSYEVNDGWRSDIVNCKIRSRFGDEWRLDKCFKEECEGNNRCIIINN